MDESLRHELFFLIAKLLKSEFPQIGEAFINECENSKKFPSLVFNAHPSFEQLEKTSLPDIPNDQLVRLIQLACPHSEYPSLLFNASQTLSKPSLASCLSAHIIPNISPIYKISPKIRVIGHSSEVYCLAFDITNQLLITGSDDYKVKVWNFQTCTLMSVFFHHSNVISDIQVHPTNDFFAISSHDFTISIISLKNLSLIHLIQLESEVHSIRFSPCGTFLAAALEEGSIRIFHVHNFEEYCAIPTPNRLAAAWLSFSPGGEFLIFSADPHDLVILSLKSLQYKTLVGHEELPEYVTFSKNSCNLILTCSYKEKNVRLWTRINSCWESTGILTLRVNNHKVKVIRACFNCDDSNIVAISANSLFCFDTQTKRLIKNSTFSPSSTFSSNTNPTPGSNNGFMNDVDDFAFLDHCCVLAMHPTIPNIAFVGCATGRCAIWDTHRCEIVSKLCHEETTKITEAVWSNDGFSVVSGDARGGFTVFTYHHRPFITIDQFFFSEFSNGNLNSLRINSNSQQNTRNNENNFSNEENQNAEENEHSDIDDITDNQRNQQQNENDGNSSVIEDRNIESNNQEMYLMNNLNHNSQFNNNIDFEIDENTITDSQAQPLIPQPEKTDISKLRLGIRAPILNDQQVIEEETIVEFWKTDNVQVSKSFESLNGEEEEEQNNVNDDKPVTSSRMSTRHSISIFDEKFDDISVNRSHIRTRNHRENRLERRLSTRNDSDRFGINNQDNIDLINEEDGIISDNGESDEEYDLTNNRRARSIDDYYDDNEYDENEYGYDHEYDYEYNIVYEEEDEEEENEYKEEELVTETETNVSITGRKMVTRRAFSPEPIKHRKRIQTRRGGRGRGNRQTRNSLSSRDEEDSRNQNENASPSLPRRKSRISDFQLFSSDSDDQALLKPSGMATRTRNKTSTAQQVQSNSHSSSTSTKKKPGRKPQTKNLEKVNEKPVVTVTGRRSIKGNSFSPPPPRKVKRRVKEIQQKTSSRRELSPPKPLKHLTDRTINDSSSKSTSRRRISPPPPHKQPLKQQSKRSRIIPDKSQNIESSNSKINLHSISRIKTRSSTTEPFDEEFPLFYHRKPRKSLQNAQKNPSKTQENNGQFKNKDEIENKEIKREKIVKNIEFEELNVNKDNEKLNHGISKRGRSGRRKTRNNSFNKEESEDDTFLSRENESSFSKKNRVKLPQNIVMPPKLKRMNKIPDFAIWDNTRMKTYVPQLGDNVVYIRDAHIQYSHECQCDFYPPPFNRKDNFPSIAFGTVTQIGFFVSSFVVRVHIEKPKIYEMRADILIPYPLAPPILIERSKFESSMTCTRNLLIGREIDFIVDDREIMSATLLSLNNDWERQPYNSITISLPNLITEPKASNDQENNDFCERISPWDIQFPLRRQGGRTSNSAISVCKQVGVFVKSLINKETNRGFFDWRLCDKEKQFANSMIRPVDFTMFLRRLSSEHYYRSPLEILEDVSRLRSTLNIISPKYHRHIDEVTTAISNSITRASEHYK